MVLFLLDNEITDLMFNEDYTMLRMPAHYNGISWWALFKIYTQLIKYFICLWGHNSYNFRAEMSFVLSTEISLV